MRAASVQPMPSHAPSTMSTFFAPAPSRATRIGRQAASFLLSAASVAALVVAVVFIV